MSSWLLCLSPHGRQETHHVIHILYEAPNLLRNASQEHNVDVTWNGHQDSQDRAQ